LSAESTDEDSPKKEEIIYMSATAFQDCLTQQSNFDTLGVQDLRIGLPKAPVLLQMLPPMERELQYLVPEDLGRELSADGAPVRLITHYFRRDGEFPQKLVKLLQLDALVEAPEALSRARLREIIDANGDQQYFLEFKSKKESSWHGKLKRLEVSFPLTRKAFLRLLPNASEGVVDKLRYSKPGFIFCDDGHRVAATFQLDHVLRAGCPERELSVPYYRGDIELLSVETALFVRRGKSTFSDVLRRCVELTALPRDVSREFSFSRLARRGLPDQLYRKAQQLLEQS